MPQPMPASAVQFACAMPVAAQSARVLRPSLDNYFHEDRTLDRGVRATATSLKRPFSSAIDGAVPVRSRDHNHRCTRSM